VGSEMCIRDSLKATVNSDDPAYFGGYLTDNIIAVSKALNLTSAEIYQTALNAIEVSFASEKRKHELMEELNQFYQKHQSNDLDIKY